jgi:hypothetical protein
MMEVIRTSKTSVNFYEATRRNIPEDSYLHIPFSPEDGGIMFLRIYLQVHMALQPRRPKLTIQYATEFQ